MYAHIPSFLNIAKIGFTTSKQDKGKKLTKCMYEESRTNALFKCQPSLVGYIGQRTIT